MEVSLNNRDIRFFKLAKNASEMSDFHAQHIGCVATYRNHVIGVGWNTSRTSPLQKRFNKYRGLDGDDVCNSLHAELMTINKIKYLDLNFSKVNLYIWRNWKNGRIALSKPCAACENAIRTIGIRSIYYTNYDGYCYERIG